MAAEVAEGGEQLVVLEVVDDHLEPPPQLGGVGPQQPLILLVGHRVDAAARPLVGLEPRAVLRHHAVPARGLEHRGEPARRDVGDDAVERLAGWGGDPPPPPPGPPPRGGGPPPPPPPPPPRGA